MRQVELVVTLWVDHEMPLDTRLLDRVGRSLATLRDAKVHYSSAIVKLRSMSDAALTRQSKKEHG